MAHAIWLFIVAILLGGAYVLLARKLIRPAPFGRRGKWVARAVLAVLLALPAVEMVLSHAPWGFDCIVLDWAGFLALGFLSFVVTGILVVELVRLPFVLGRKIRGLFRVGRGHVHTARETVQGSRTSLVVNAVNVGILVLASAATGYGVYEARRSPAVEEIDVPIPHLPRGLEGFRIVQVTDLHVGLTVRRDFIERVVETVSELRGDVLVLTGDLADGPVSCLHDDVRPFARLSPPHGKFFVTGNHEYYSGVQQWVEEARRLGFTILHNDHRVLERANGRLALAGVPDENGGFFDPLHRPDPAAALAGAPPADVRILLAHQPQSLYAALPCGYDLMITGHTHGGQFLPWSFFAAMVQPHIAGLHRHGGMWVYVGRGTGYWGPPVRLGARSEIAVLRLKAVP
ncbi:MAG: metallophosphoesterase [Bacteroidota bacterium]|nr:metallophosphoesterase [Bacteroidota bacterium]